MRWIVLLLSFLSLAVFTVVRIRENGAARKPLPASFRAAGADLIVNMIGACAEEFEKGTRRSVDVSGGGSGIGIYALIDGKVDVAYTVRRMTEDEVCHMEMKTGSRPREFRLGYAAAAIVVPRDSPVMRISIEELREIFGENGAIDLWEQVDGSGLKGPIRRAARAGSDLQFQDSVLGAKGDSNRKEMKRGTLCFQSSSDIIKFVATTPDAIGYVGLGYVFKQVKALPLALAKGTEPIAPTDENVQTFRYPLTRELFLYTSANPTPEAMKFVNFMTGKVGQELVKDKGFVPLAKE